MRDFLQSISVVGDASLPRAFQPEISPGFIPYSCVNEHRNTPVSRNTTPAYAEPHSRHYKRALSSYRYVLKRCLWITSEQEASFLGGFLVTSYRMKIRQMRVKVNEKPSKIMWCKRKKLRDNLISTPPLCPDFLNPVCINQICQFPLNHFFAVLRQICRNVLYTEHTAKLEYVHYLTRSSGISVRCVFYIVLLYLTAPDSSICS